MSAAPAPTLDRATAQAAAKKASAIFDEPANAETVKKVMEAAAGDMGRTSETLLAPALPRRGTSTPICHDAFGQEDQLAPPSAPLPPTPLLHKGIDDGNVSLHLAWRCLAAGNRRVAAPFPCTRGCS